MIGTVRPSNPAPPQFRTAPARAPIDRLPRQLDVLGALPNRQMPETRPAGRIDIRV